MQYTFTSRLMQMASGGAVDATATDKELRDEFALARLIRDDILENGNILTVREYFIISIPQN